MRLMIYLLLHNPTILYSPNGTAADDIIKKVSETFWQIKYIIFILLHLWRRRSIFLWRPQVKLYLTLYAHFPPVATASFWDF